MESLDTICTDCDFNYIISDEIGAIEYCVVTERYYNEMLGLKKCKDLRIDGVYING